VIDGAVAVFAVGFRLGDASLPGWGPEPRLIGWDGQRGRQHDPPVLLGHDELIAFFKVHPVDQITRDRQDVLLTEHGLVHSLPDPHNQPPRTIFLQVYQSPPGC
jgi:hypothetical protein